MATTVSVRIGERLAEAIKAHLKGSMYLNKSDFLRDSIREKLTRDAPGLMQPQEVQHDEEVA